MPEPSLGEVVRDLQRVSARVDRLAERWDDAPFVRSDLHSEQMGSVRKAVEDLGTRVNYLLGLLVSSIIGAIIVLVISAGRGGA
jgi:hypothetical protein